MWNVAQSASRREGGLTILARVDPNKKVALKELLERIDDEWMRNVDPQNAVLPLGQIKTIHFARLVMLDETDELVLSTCFDRSRDQQLSDLSDLVTAGLHRILLHCHGYWSYGGSIPQRILQYLKDHDVGVGTPYVATPGFSVRTILSHKNLQEYLRARLDALTDGERGLPARQVVELLRAGAPSSAVPPLPSRLSVAGYYAGAFAKLAVAGALVASVAPLSLALLQEEWEDAKAIEREGLKATPSSLSRARRAEDRRTEELEKDESRWALNKRGPQSALTHLVPAKPGLVRWLALRFSLAYVAYRARYWDNQGQLAGITGIHFARWVVLPRGRLLFLSDYDGNWEGYLGEFVDDGPLGLSAVWSNTEHFPRTRYLVAEGARDERTFKRWVRGYQRKTTARYSAYPSLTVRNILDNSALAEGLTRRLNESEAEEWLARI